MNESYYSAQCTASEIVTLVMIVLTKNSLKGNACFEDSYFAIAFLFIVY